jgi:hypothetical protein
MKPTKTFKMPKPVKRFLATLSKENRNSYKRQMINACLCYEEHLKKSLRGKEKEAVE